MTNEFGVVQGLVTPLDVLEAIAGEFPDADETPEIVIDGDGWLIKGSTDLHALQQALGLDPLINDDEDIATVAGLVISANGHIPRIGDVVSLPPLHFTVVERMTTGSIWFARWSPVRRATKKSNRPAHRSPWGPVRYSVASRLASHAGNASTGIGRA
ncbi:magnesium and cobalt efflux protein CorC [Klebsiella quasipneumoniae]|nr:magnesium and cobalt efflux protein CorC [Klebsiella quasipneumoniae]